MAYGFTLRKPGEKHLDWLCTFNSGADSGYVYARLLQTGMKSTGIIRLSSSKRGRTRHAETAADRRERRAGVGRIRSRRDGDGGGLERYGAGKSSRGVTAAFRHALRTPYGLDKGGAQPPTHDLFTPKRQRLP